MIGNYIQRVDMLMCMDNVSMHLYMYLSPIGRYVECPVGVQLRSLSIYWVRNGILDYKTQKGLSRFFARKCFIPRREMRSISSRGRIVFTYV